MKALSVRTPWWWFILHGGKDIENRDWPTNFRGDVLLHAGKWWQYQDGLDDIRAALDCCGTRRSELAGRLRVEEDLLLARGCIVGQVTIVHCVSRSPSPWFFGDYGFVLANPVAFKNPLPFKGSLGFFEVPNSVILAAKVGV